MSEKSQNFEVRRFVVRCVAGPWYEGEEISRTVDLPANATLFDLHEAILEAMSFEDVYPFYFFRAEELNADRTMVPAAFELDPLKENICDDVYEEMPAAREVADKSDDTLYEAFLSEGGDWFFEIKDGGAVEKTMPPDFYPFIVESLSVGPDPVQYGYGFDDFATNDAAFAPPSPDAAGDAGGEPEGDSFGDGEDEEEEDDDESGSAPW